MVSQPATPATNDPALDASLGACAGSGMLAVEVVYALAQHQAVIHLNLPDGSTLQQALEASRLLQEYPEIDLTRNKLGIFGKTCKAETLLRDRDRIEVYRPLLADPKEVRQQRAGKRKLAGKGGE